MMQILQKSSGWGAFASKLEEKLSPVCSGLPCWPSCWVWEMGHAAWTERSNRSENGSRSAGQGTSPRVPSSVAWESHIAPPGIRGRLTGLLSRSQTARFLTCCRAASVLPPWNIRCKIEPQIKELHPDRTDIWRNVTIECCLVYTFPPRNSVSPSNQVMASKVTKSAGKLPFPAALTADIAPIGFGEAKNPDFAAWVFDRSESIVCRRDLAVYLGRTRRSNTLPWLVHAFIGTQVCQHIIMYTSSTPKKSKSLRA